MIEAKEHERNRKRRRESRYLRVTRIAHAAGQETLPCHSYPKSPHICTLPQLAACVLSGFYLDTNYRDPEEWLLATERVLELGRVPDRTTPYRAYRLGKDEAGPAGEAGVEGKEEGIATDSTGFRLTRASAYYQSRTYREWIKGIYAVGTKTQLILAWRTGKGPGSDAPYLHGLKREIRRYGEAWLLLADSGFDGAATEGTWSLPSGGEGTCWPQSGGRGRGLWIGLAWTGSMGSGGRAKRCSR